MKAIPNSISPELLRRREAAQMLGISQRNLDLITARGELKSVRVGLRSRRWALADLRQYILDLRTKGGAM